MITYSTVLRFYVPEERGDFFYRYKISNRLFVLYSPESNVVSCLELYHFREITPIELATIIGSDLPGDTLDEFHFNKVCSKDKIVSFLFDIRESSNEIVIGHVSNMQGFLLYDIFSPAKVRNVFLYSIETNEHELLFDNDICYAEVNSQSKSNNIICLCWNPIIFKDIDEWVGEGSWSFLLPSNKNILYSYIFSQQIDSNTSYTLLIENESLKALFFIESYLVYQNMNFNISIESDDKMIIIHLSSWSSTKVMNFVSRIQKRCTSEVKRSLEIEDGLSGSYFQCKLVGSDSFLIFPNIEICCNAVCKELIDNFSLNNIHIVNNRDGQANLIK